jgi:hypothetical protein
MQGVAVRETLAAPQASAVLALSVFLANASLVRC